MIKLGPRPAETSHVTSRAQKARSTPRLFATYAAITLVPVLILGVVLAASYRTEARARGVAQGKSEALLVGQTAVEPLLDGRLLSKGLTPTETMSLHRLAARAVGAHDILRLRLRDLSGFVVFSDDGSGFGLVPEVPARAAARGVVTARLIRLNSDDNDTGPVGPPAVEVYQPLYAAPPSHQLVGVLEMYLPYAPINADVSAGLNNLYRDLALGLGALYLALFVISVSVSRRLRQQVRMNKFLAEHDSLTELPNRDLFHQRVEEALATSSRDDGQTVIAIVDLDRFKEVNDTLGHHNGDRVLIALADRLSESKCDSDSVARLGGDEFGLVLCDVADPETALRRLRAMIEHEVEVNGLPLSVESSIGYVVAPDDGRDADELLQRADVAMYIAKFEHQGVARYDKARDHYDAADLELIAQLRHAIEDDELVLHYQPKTTLADDRVEAVEALVRWQHPIHGLLAPDRFIPMAEQTDLIDKLTAWVLDRALTDIRDFGSDASRLAVAVNVSARNLVRSNFAHQVIEKLEALDVSPERLIIEITETALLTDPPRAAVVLAELDAAGVSVSLDDFGIGQTSLGYLSSLPVRELKIDMSFIRDMLVNPAHAAIVRSIVDLGHNLSLLVVGEGVETEDVLVALREAGCDLAQGFLLARPMPIDRLREWLRTPIDQSFLTDSAGLGAPRELRESVAKTAHG